MTRPNLRESYLKIRYVSADEKMKLKKIANENGFSSIQLFMRNQIDVILASKEILNFDIIAREREATMIETIQANSKVLEETNNYLKAIYGVED